MYSGTSYILLELEIQTDFLLTIDSPLTDKCFIQFIETNNYITFGTAIAAFYAPVTVMCVLYWRVWRETEKRQKDLSNLQAGKKNDSHRSNSRYLAWLIEAESK